MVPDDVTKKSWEIEKMLDSRIINGVKEYLVKWKDSPHSENNSEKESHFNSIETIVALEVQVQGGLVKRKLGRPSKSWMSLVDKQSGENKNRKPVEDQVGVKRKPGGPKLSTNLVLALLMILSIITGGLGMEIKGKFKFCDLFSFSNIVLDVSRSCSRSGLDIKRFDTSRNYSILRKTKHAVNGKSPLCKMMNKEYTYTMTF